MMRSDTGSRMRRASGLALACGLLFLAGMELPAQTAPADSGWTTSQTEAYPRKRDDIFFVDRTTGFYGTGAGNLFRTDDGGQTWQRIWQQPGTFIRALAFIDRDRGFLGNLGQGLANTTDSVPLYRTADGGRSWSAVALPAPIAGVCAIDILRTRSIVEGAMRERLIIHAAGRANGPAALARSEDGGETWTVTDFSDRLGMILDVKFTDPSTGFIFAGSSADLERANAVILKTTNGGRTWREVYRSNRPFEIIWKSSFPTERTAFATLQNNDPANTQQRIVRTTDGGEHWEELPLVADGRAHEFGIGFVDEQTGWVGTAIGGFETRDGGRSWARTGLAPMANKIRTRAGDGSPFVYAIGTEVQFRR